MTADPGQARVPVTAPPVAAQEPVLADLSARPSRLAAFAHSFSRSSLLDETPAGGEIR